MDLFYLFFFITEVIKKDYKSCSIGSRTVNSVPFSGTDWKEILPLWASAILLQIGSPRPVPSCLWVMNGSKRSS